MSEVKLTPLEVLEIAVDALRDLEICFNPPPGTSTRGATVKMAQELVRAAVYKALPPNDAGRAPLLPLKDNANG